MVLGARDQKVNYLDQALDPRYVNTAGTAAIFARTGRPLRAATAAVAIRPGFDPRRPLMALSNGAVAAASRQVFVGVTMMG